MPTSCRLGSFQHALSRDMAVIMIGLRSDQLPGRELSAGVLGLPHPRC